MKRLIGFSLMVLMLVSCASTTWVEKDYENQKGVIKYQDQGLKYFTDKNNSEAMGEISNFCKGNYTITKETTESVYKGKSVSEKGKSQSVSSSKDVKKSEKTFQSSSFETENYEDYIFVYFKCNRSV